ncbi:amidohydrolase family protein [Hyperthermus butylicus]|uniref:Cytosine deaminase n=1 Tax=Hyperthermus butylicus (strain DSM 5456 / JCM 9403 / PLM1-5) TaxID=415426 RepID=A2BK51_HYPBU|nr:amidohydrolase family protein [Hyperthermus butylicus]ABM80362.1 Cytosine deaminase [Hyperthermus butylicus DSM 5456]
MKAPEAIVLRRCLLLRCARCGIEGPADIAVVDGLMTAPSAVKGRDVVEVDCKEELVVAPCMYVANMVLAPLGTDYSSVMHGELDDALLEAARLSGERLIQTAERLATELPSLGMCGAAIATVDPLPAAKTLLEHGLRVQTNIAYIPNWSHVERLASELDKQCNQLGNYGDLMSIGIEVFASRLVDDKELQELVRLARSKSIPLFIHASTSKRDVYESKKKWGLFPVERLEKLGVLGKDTVIVGGGWVSSWELGYIASRGSAIVHNPVHDMLHGAGGHFPLREALDAGIRVGLGLGLVDSFLDLRLAATVELLLQRYVYWDSRVGAADVFSAASEGSANILSFTATGKIEHGSPGDLVVYRVRGLSQSLLTRNPALALLAGGKPVYTIIAGRIVHAEEDSF